VTQWCVAHSQARAEDKAAFHLRRQGFDVFLPKHLKRRRHARRVDWVPAPLFPRYFFVRLDAQATRWRAILSTVGISDLVRFGDRPALVPPDVVDEIRVREDADGLVRTTIDGLRPGDPVQVIAGPFADAEGLFDGANDDRRVTVLLSLMGRQVKVRVPVEAVHASA
jgi:transcriptional antiterminator RfaH